MRAPRPVLRGRTSAKDSGDGRREADSYNPTSLAIEEAHAFEGLPSVLDHGHTCIEEPLPPPLVISRRGAMHGVPSSALWKGLDPLAAERSSGSSYISFVIHVLAITAVLWWSLTAHNRVVQPVTTATKLDFTLYAPPPLNPPLLKVAKPMHGGGGGGRHRLIDPNLGRRPKFSPRVQIQAPQIQQVVRPPIPVEPTIQANLPDNSKLPNLGMTQSPQVAMASQGAGSENGFGIGVGGGMGAGHGAGAGAGSGGYGGGVMSVGGGVSAPEVIYSPDPQFTAQARQADYQGTVAIQLIVDAEGRPQDIHVVRHLGMGLDEKAVEAVRQYRFRPAMYEGHPVVVQMIIEVGFHLH